MGIEREDMNDKKTLKPGRIEITTKIGCKINCKDCPQDMLTKKYFEKDKNRDSEMSLETFQKCVDKLPEGTRIDFSGMCEPWLNNSCTDMVLYANKKGYPIAVYTTLVGMSLDDFECIKDIDFEEFVVHVPDDRDTSSIPITPEYLELFRAVIESKKATGFSCHAGINLKIENEMPEQCKLINEMQDRAGNLDNEYLPHQHKQGELVCVNCGEGMNHNVLLPDGTVLLCCMDYGMKHIMGNLLYQSYYEIIFSNEAETVRRGLNDDSLNTLCRTCCNAKKAMEIYGDYEIFKDWVKNQQRQIEEQIVLLRDYEKTVQDYEKTVRDYKEYTVRTKECIKKLTDDWNAKNEELENTSYLLKRIKNTRSFKKVERELRK